MLSRAAPLGGAVATPGLAPLRLAPTSPHPSLPCLHALPLLSSPVPSQLLPTFLFLRRLSVPITPSTSLLLTSHVESTLLPKLYFLLYCLPDGPLLYLHIPPLLAHQAYSPPLLPPLHLQHSQQPPPQGPPKRDWRRKSSLGRRVDSMWEAMREQQRGQRDQRKKKTRRKSEGSRREGRGG